MGCTPKDLWKVCNDYGTVVDVFIPNKKSKAGKRFAFVRFIKDHVGSYVNVVNGSFTVVVPGPYISSASALVLDDSCVVERDLSKYAMGKVKDVNFIPNLRTLLMDEGFFDVKLKYLGGMWVMFEFDKVDTKVNMMQHIGVKSWFHVIQEVVHDFVSDERIVWVEIEEIPLNVWSRETFMRIGKKWGETLDIEDNVDSSVGRKRLCIKTKQPVSILESFKIIFKGKVLLVRAKELFTWNPTFLAHKEMVYASEDESVHSPKKIPAHSLFSEEVSGDDSDSDVEEVSETIFCDNSSSPNNNSDEMGKQHSEDPFKIYDILKKQTGGETREVSSSLSHPPGFTPEVSEIRKENDQGAEEFPSLVNAKVMNNSQEVYQEINRESVDPNVIKEGGFVLGVLEDMTRVGQAMGEAVGNSGGILCVGEAKVFKKDYATISDNFVAIYGTWLPSNSKILFVAIYAPQQASCKRVLWEYVSTLIGRWNGETIILGDFNEVRSIDERRGSCFNPSSARVFNHFISSSGLVDVKLEGYTFTWSHPSGSKMSKLDRFLVSEGIFSIFPSITALCLDRHLSDHRSILLRENKGETIHDYYVQFAKLINDMRNNKMTMSRMQLNSKLVNNMLPEWDQQYYSQSSTTPPSICVQPYFADNTKLNSGLSLTDNLITNLTNTLSLLTQSYKTYLLQTNNQLRTSSNTRNQATVQNGRVVVQNVQGQQNRGQGNNAWGAGATSYGGAQNRVVNANPSQASKVFEYYIKPKLPIHFKSHLKNSSPHKWSPKEDQGRSRKEELSKFEAKNQGKEALEVITRRTKPKPPILTHF
nr:RNA-directed DNA polymerase, eukaryota [Tanacetum cinerariifolium]